MVVVLRDLGKEVVIWSGLVGYAAVFTGGCVAVAGLVGDAWVTSAYAGVWPVAGF